MVRTGKYITLLLSRDYAFVEANMTPPTSRLTDEILDFLVFMARSPKEIAARLNFTRNMINSIKTYFQIPDHDVVLYGSDATGLGLPTSDIDLMIRAPNVRHRNPYVERDLKVKALQGLEYHLMVSGFSLRTTLREEAVVPILEMEDTESGLEMDISFEEPHVVRSLEDMTEWKARYGANPLVCLVLLMKHALNIRKLGLGTATTPYQVCHRSRSLVFPANLSLLFLQGGVGSYVIVCMVVAFLEVRVPAELKELWSSDNSCTVNYGTLFLGLLQFWGLEFDYETTAVAMNPPALVPKSPALPVGCVLIRNAFRTLTVIAFCFRSS
jgi:non-canonical poly(A) RNA polymerase PAPD5/7